jgi:hypothetical protein
MGFSKWGITLYGSSLGEPGGGSFAMGPEGYERKALGMGSLFMGAQLGNLSGLIYRGL